MLMPYLRFSGNCEEALLFYANIFDGKIESLSRYTVETGGPGLAGKVMHGCVSLGANRFLSASDNPELFTIGNAMDLLVHCDARKEAERICDGLALGGHLIQRLTPHPPPDDGGMGALIKDKYGYTWIITAPNDHQ